MYIEIVPNRGSRPAILLRESYREDGKIKKRTLLNLTDVPTPIVEGFRAVLKGGKVQANAEDPIVIRRSLPHGHVAAVLGVLRQSGLDRLLGPESRTRSLAIAMIVQRLVAPASKLATARRLDPETAADSLGAVLELGAVDENELYAALDALLERQDKIETALARKHLHDGALVLYDVSSSYLEGQCCPLAKRGYNRDGKKGKLQIVYGLLCARDGTPIAVHVFEGDTGDPSTLATQVDTIKQRFGLTRVVLVGDRGMITQARIDETLRPANLDWITALRAGDIQALAEGGALQMSLFDQRDMASITSPDYPGERLVVCRNGELARLRARKREALLLATEGELSRIVRAVARRKSKPLSAAQIGVRVGKVVCHYKMAKHFALDIEDGGFAFRRKTEEIAREAALDGVYVVRSPVPAEDLDDAELVGAYKSLSQVERAFRCLKTIDLHLRPIFHWNARRVRAHVLLCMLAFYVEHHLREKLAPILFDETDPEAAAAARASVVAKAQRSAAAKAKDASKRTSDDLPVHSLRTLFDDLATFTRMEATTTANESYVLTLYPRPTPLQKRAFDLLGVNAERSQ